MGLEVKIIFLVFVNVMYILPLSILTVFHAKLKIVFFVLWMILIRVIFVTMGMY